MKHLKYMPIAFLAGAHGFALLAPYLAICAAANALMLQRRRRAAALAPAQPSSL
ncbi:MAG: hypothetical protein H7144_02700 [Burkholderiales bacterium]|nr:hypothetical protein [Phycisphaerae bacterium]